MVGYRPDGFAHLQAGRRQHQRPHRQGKNAYGRQLARVHAPQYHETLFSRIYPGKQHSKPVYIPVLRTLDGFLQLGSAQKQRTVIRSDAGFGSDDNVDFALDEGWQVLTKGLGGRRPVAYARQVSPEAWQDLGQGHWMAPSPHPPHYLRPVQHWVQRWLVESGELRYATLLCSVMEWSAAEALRGYEDRGACETEILADKSGLKLCKRRKHRVTSQEALILLTDLAHNALAWNAPILFPEGPLAGFSTVRLIEDVLAIPGRLIFDDKHLQEVHLNQRHPHAQATAAGLTRLLEHYGNP